MFHHSSTNDTSNDCAPTPPTGSGSGSGGGFTSYHGSSLISADVNFGAGHHGSLVNFSADVGGSHGNSFISADADFGSGWGSTDSTGTYCGPTDGGGSHIASLINADAGVDLGCLDTGLFANVGADIGSLFDTIAHLGFGDSFHC